MKYSEQYDIGALIEPKFGGQSATEDAEVTGDVVDREDRNSVTLALAFEATLAEDETLTADLKAQHGGASDGSDMADYDRSGSVTGKVVATGGAGGTTESGVVELDVRLDEAKKFIRGVWTLTTSGAGTVDGAALVAVLGGGPKTPI